MSIILIADSNSKEGPEMRDKILLALCLSMLFLFPNQSLAECTSIGRFSNFVLEGQNTVTLYAGSMPVARFDVNCNVQPSSRIRLLKTDVCDGDDILIDDAKCVMLQIKPLGP